MVDHISILFFLINPFNKQYRKKLSNYHKSLTLKTTYIFFLNHKIKILTNDVWAMELIVILMSHVFLGLGGMEKTERQHLLSITYWFFNSSTS